MKETQPIASATVATESILATMLLASLLGRMAAKGVLNKEDISAIIGSSAESLEQSRRRGVLADSEATYGKLRLRAIFHSLSESLERPDRLVRDVTLEAHLG